MPKLVWLTTRPGVVDLDQLEGRDLGVLDGAVAEPDHVAAQDPAVAVERHGRALVGDVVEPEEHSVLVEVGVLDRASRDGDPRCRWAGASAAA